MSTSTVTLKTSINGSNSGILRVEEAAGEREVMRGSRDSHRCE